MKRLVPVGLLFLLVMALALPVVHGSSIAALAYDLIQDEGTPLTRRSTINFTGAGVTASDSGGLTLVNIPGGGGITQGDTHMLALCDPSASTLDIQWAGDTAANSTTCGAGGFPPSLTTAFTSLPTGVVTLSRTTFMLPPNWDSSTAIDAVVFWGTGDSPASGLVDLSAAISCLAVNTSFVSAVMYNAATLLQVNEGTTPNLRKISTLASLNKNGCVANSPVALRVGRNGTSGDSSLTNAYFLGARLVYRTLN